jgi:2-(1,2-epoxy-1,2-dihydrophenyl)acetyl-CoA isomerase
MSNEILFDRHDGAAWITINRPSVKNAMTKAMAGEMASIVRELKGDTATRVVVFRGNGPDFTAGADLKDEGDGLSDNPAERARQVGAMARALAWPLFLGLHELRQPVVSSIRGHVIGVGAQLVLSSDLTVASETARLLLPQTKLAHAPDHGESYYLPRKIGTNRAMQHLLLSEPITAALAERYDLVNWVVPDAELEKKTDEIVEKMARAASVAVYETKALLRESGRRSVSEQYAAEADALERCAATEDFPEAMRAFIEKRPSRFKGC